MSKATVEVKGTWPILKYTVRTEHGGYAVVMIDDQHGSVLINPGDQIALQHWWGKDGRGEDKLRSFLVRASISYLEDKFSYGLKRWTFEEAMQDLDKECKEHFGKKPSEWPGEVKECIQHLKGHGDMSSDLFYYIIGGYDVIMEKFGYDTSFGNIDAHPDVSFFLKTKWPALVEHWKMELENEAKKV